MPMLQTFVYLICIFGALGVGWWAFRKMALPQPFQIIAVVVVAIVAIMILLQLVGSAGSLHPLSLR